MKVKQWAKRVINTADPYSQHFNTSIKFQKHNWYVNERIVEIPFVHKQIVDADSNKSILEFGCTRSELAFSLASFGYQVTGVDLRGCQFTHPNFTFYQGDILNFPHEQNFDYITAVSVIEHIGLGAYGEDRQDAKLEQVIAQLILLLNAGGKLIVTVPFGQQYTDQFLRSFTHEQINDLFSTNQLTNLHSAYFKRQNGKHWLPCTLSEAATVSNERINGITGVNCVGCFVWQKN